MTQRITEANVPSAPGVKDRVGQDQLSIPGADVELDYVDPDLTRHVERGERVAGGKCARAAMPNPLADVRAHCTPKDGTTGGGSNPVAS